MSLATHDAPVVECSTDVAKYVELQESNPDTDFTVETDSELNKQCHLNKILKNLRKKGPASVGPASPSE